MECKDNESRETIFVLGDSELPKTTARAIDLSKFVIDKADRMSMSMTTERAKVHKLQKCMDQNPPYQPALDSADLAAVHKMKPDGDCAWLEGVYVPAQIFSALMWNNIAKAFKGFTIPWIVELKFCDLTGGTTKTSRHANRWTRIAKCIGTIIEASDLQLGDKRALVPQGVDPTAMMDRPLTNKLLLDVYTSLADAETWTGFIDDARLVPLRTEEIYERHAERYNAVYEAYPFQGTGGAVHVHTTENRTAPHVD